MIEETLSEKVLEKIEKEKIKPFPRILFLLKEYSVWILFAITLLVGGLSTSVLIFVFKNNDWDMIGKAERGFFNQLVFTLPYFWIILLIVLLLVSFYEFKKTKIGYKYNPLVIFVASIIFSVILGSITHALGGGSKIEKDFAEKIPFYENTLMPMQAAWHNPDGGSIAGQIFEVEDEENFTIKDRVQGVWKIICENCPFVIAPGQKVKVFGEIKEPGVFIANEIRPLVGPRDMLQLPLKDRCGKNGEIKNGCARIND